jgi:hypothetical protein
MLMHVTPNEVSGLQALAQRHGGSLTVNPQTGLPEANIFDDIGLGDVNKFVPAIAGAGLTLMGVDPITAAGMVGGLAGLTSGSLSQGIQAGLGAYGGASLTGSLGAMGGAANANAAAQAADAGATGPLSGNAFSNAAGAPDVGAGFKEATSSFGAAKDFLKSNPYALGALALPALMGAKEEDATPGAAKHPGYIRRYEKNPVTGALEQVEAVPVDEFGGRSAVSFGGVGRPVSYADGGSVLSNLFDGRFLHANNTNNTNDTAPVVSFGGVSARTPVVRDPNDTRTDSQKAYDYLMGNTGAKNPMLFYHDQGTDTGQPVAATAPVDLNTRTGGHYEVNKNTGAYDWIPDAAKGLPALVAAPQRGSNAGNMGNVGNVGSVGGGELGAVANNAISNAGLVALGKIANAFSLGDTNSYSPAVSDAQGVSNNGGGVGGGFGIGQAGASMGGPNGGGFGPTSGNGPGPGGAGGGAGGDGGSGPGTGGAGGSGVGNARGGYIHMASGGLGSLGGYSDGGQLLKGPGDGVSDSIPATIGKAQPARLADGEFVVPARIVSELGNGSTEAGAKQLYAMMARIQAGRAKTTGKNQVAKNSKADRHLPA